MSTAACLRIAATAPNFVLQEFPNDTWDVTDKRPDSDSFLVAAARHDGEGFLTISDEPGIGVSLRPDAAENSRIRQGRCIPGSTRTGRWWTSKRVEVGLSVSSSNALGTP
ncbi:hypothetical protein [Mesorhizobium sp.]|uniref:hypothetical protein n=1 Tax=Mesorhizobium sp. TaxID=1871066 RepID=UPI00344FE4A4